MIKNPWFKIKPPEERSPFWWFRWVPTLVVSGLILYFLYVVGSVALIPVLASFALAFLLNPIVQIAESRGLSRDCFGGRRYFACNACHHGVSGVCHSRSVGGNF